jgi:hypothetical protein
MLGRGARQYEILIAIYQVSFPAALALCFAGSVFAQSNSDWDQPFPPHRVIGNIVVDKRKILDICTILG